MYPPVWLHIPYVWVLGEDIRHPWNWSYMQLWTLRHECQNLHSGPPEEHQVLFSTEPPPTPVFLLRVTLLLCFQATSLYFTTIAQTSLLLWRPGKQMIKYSPKMCAPVRQGQCKQLQPLQPTHKKDKCNKHAWTTRDTDKHLRQPTLKAHRGIIHLVLLIDFSQDIREQCLRQNTPKPSLLGLSASVCSPLSDP